MVGSEDNNVFDPLQVKTHVFKLTSRAFCFEVEMLKKSMFWTSGSESKTGFFSTSKLQTKARRVNP